MSFPDADNSVEEGPLSVRILAMVVSLLPLLSGGWQLPTGQGAHFSSHSGFFTKKDQQIQRDSGRGAAHSIQPSLEGWRLPLLG